MRGVQSCLPLARPLKTLGDRGRPWADRSSLCFLWSETSSFPSVPRWREPTHPLLQCPGQK